jgi:hypothetical protein
MASTTKIIDAVSEPVENSSKAAPMAGGMQSVPVKIDASQMQKVLQGLVGKQPQFLPGVSGATNAAAAGVQTDAPVERINPSVYMKSISEEMERLYARFDKLKKLAVELHGRQLDTPLPDHVRLKNIVINFSLLKDGKEEEHTAEIFSVSSVGDLTGIMSTEFGSIILALSEQSKQLEDLAQKTGERCSSALKEWENNNKDKKIVRTDAAADVTVGSAENQNDDKPVTLEAS